MAEDVDVPEGGMTTDMGGLITFVPDVDLEWELGFEIDIVFTPDEA